MRPYHYPARRQSRREGMGRMRTVSATFDRGLKAICGPVQQMSNGMSRLRMCRDNRRCSNERWAKA